MDITKFPKALVIKDKDNYFSKGDIVHKQKASGIMYQAYGKDSKGHIWNCLAHPNSIKPLS